METNNRTTTKKKNTMKRQQERQLEPKQSMKQTPEETRVDLSRIASDELASLVGESPVINCKVEGVPVS